MNKCQICGAERLKSEVRCAQCGEFYPTLTELLDAEVFYEEQQTLKGLLKRILGAETIKQGLSAEFKKFKALNFLNSADKPCFIVSAPKILLSNPLRVCCSS